MKRKTLKCIFCPQKFRTQKARDRHISRRRAKNLLVSQNSRGFSMSFTHCHEINLYQ